LRDDHDADCGVIAATNVDDVSSTLASGEVGVGAVTDGASALSFIPKLLKPRAEKDHFFDIRLGFCEPRDGVSADVDSGEDGLGMSGEP
jgi:hypothetical protein